MVGNFFLYSDLPYFRYLAQEGKCTASVRVALLNCMKAVLEVIPDFLMFISMFISMYIPKVYLKPVPEDLLHTSVCILLYILNNNINFSLG